MGAWRGARPQSGDEEHRRGIAAERTTEGWVSQPHLIHLAQLMGALLHGQSPTPSALMRALLSPTPVPARQRYKRVARALDRPWLTSAWLTPRLVRAVRALLPSEKSGATAHSALDSMCRGRWEAFTVGVVWRGRMAPVAWAVLPYPWPKGRVTPTVCALVAQAAAAWSQGETRAAHLVADRAFPGKRLFTALRRAGWGWTIRLRAPMPVTLGDERLRVRDLLGRASHRLEGLARGLRAWARGAGRNAGGRTRAAGAPGAPTDGGQPASPRRAPDRAAARGRLPLPERGGDRPVDGAVHHAHHLAGGGAQVPQRRTPVGNAAPPEPLCPYATSCPLLWTVVA